ncbi:metal ABC transporter permease [Gulosibacter sp. ACHW.36C]|uniref:Metal ABC transporter permease n=1 Tax=Gulosibacter sediminis TaxID=1729695 RepID=A0ABY4MWL6_9MICO|nr:metal ABC transporter permease [Gulosibacter sediminis]UQN14769.1 metal ABC transporter permease [Gulosibacter sediminis]
MTIFASALVTGILVGLLCGIVGSLVVLRQRAFFTVALTHATFPGGVLAAILGVHIVLGAFVMGLVLVGFMLLLGRIRRQGRQVAAGIVLSFGYALGVFMHSLVPGLQSRVDSFLTGSIIGIPASSILIIAGMLLVAIVAVTARWKDLLFSTFDREGFVASGGSEARVEALTLVLIVGTVVSTMPAIGSILAISMIAAPAAAAKLLVRRIEWMIPVASALGAGSAVLGLYASQWFSIAAGGSMALAATLVFLIALALNRGARRLVPGYTGGEVKYV